MLHYRMRKLYHATSGFDEGDDEKAIEILKKWDGNIISDALFTELARFSPLSVIELVVLREHEGNLQTLLVERPENDPVWPNMIHTPGTVLRLSDFKRARETEPLDPLKHAFARICNGELSQHVENIDFVGNLYRMGERGAENVQVYIGQLPDDAELEHDQIWYDVATLAENERFIQSQIDHVKMCEEFWVDRKIR